MTTTEAEPDDMANWLILDTRPNDLYPGLAVWWGPDRCGYTTDLRKAGVYTYTEAKQQERKRSTDRAVPRALAVSTSMQVVDAGALKRALTRP